MPRQGDAGDGSGTGLGGGFGGFSGGGRDSDYSNEGRNHSAPTGDAPGNSQSPGGGWEGGGDYSNEGRNSTPTGTAPGDTQSPGGGWMGSGGWGSSDKANLDDDAGMAKAMWAGLTKVERQALNEHLGRPAEYGNSEDDGKLSFKDKLFDLTNPSFKSKAYALGIRGMGATFDTVEKQESLNPNLKDDRFAALNDIAKGIVNVAMPAPVKAAMTVARAIDAVQNDKMSAIDAVKNAMFDIGMPSVLGAVSKGIYNGIGPDAYAGYSAVNKAIGLANLGGANLPTVNKAISAGIRNALDIKGFGPQSGVTDASGTPANPAGGSTFEGVGGSWGRSDSGTVSTPTVGVQTPTVAVPGYDYQSSRIDLDGTAFGRGLRSNVINRFSRR